MSHENRLGIILLMHAGLIFQNVENSHYAIFDAQGYDMIVSRSRPKGIYAAVSVRLYYNLYRKNK